MNTNYAFFIGKAGYGEDILINDEKVYVASNGAFAHSVKLKNGENRVLIRSNYQAQVYKIYKKSNCIAKKEAELVEFATRKVLVRKDNTPLRNTPIDFGMNRISHLFKDTTILINGEKGDFYRVFLSKNKLAWIAKKDVLESGEYDEIANFVTADSKTFKNASIQTIKFTKNIPYIVEEKENELIFKVYNPEQAEESVYTLNIPKPEKYKYHVSLKNGEYVFKVSEIPKTIENCTIMIDPGHGGTEKGAIGCLGDFEKDINLKIALELERVLKEKGANVILTRYCDGNISLEERTDFAKVNDVEFFISIHLNSIPDICMDIHKNKGTSIYYYNNNSRNFAEILERTISKYAGTRKDGVRTASFAVIRPHDYIGVLIEAAYMTNPMDSVLYKSEDFIKNVAKGVTDGLEEFINTNT